MRRGKVTMPRVSVIIPRIAKTKFLLSVASNDIIIGSNSSNAEMGTGFADESSASWTIRLQIGMPDYEVLKTPWGESPLRGRSGVVTDGTLLADAPRYAFPRITVFQERNIPLPHMATTDLAAHRQ
jgi:hypothetical protein